MRVASQKTSYSQKHRSRRAFYDRMKRLQRCIRSDGTCLQSGVKNQSVTTLSVTSLTGCYDLCDCLTDASLPRITVELRCASDADDDCPRMTRVMKRSCFPPPRMTSRQCMFPRRTTRGLKQHSNPLHFVDEIRECDQFAALAGTSPKRFRSDSLRSLLARTSCLYSHSDDTCSTET
jgi:hypothetical protein